MPVADEVRHGAPPVSASATARQPARHRPPGAAGDDFDQRPVSSSFQNGRVVAKRAPWLVRGAMAALTAALRLKGIWGLLDADCPGSGLYSPPPAAYSALLAWMGLLSSSARVAGASV